MTIYLPYTYLIGWSKLDTWYYGCRYGAGANRIMCNPTDLWVSYFTSSKHVKTFRAQNGEPDIIQVRRTFVDGDSARMWEHRVLRRLGVIHNDKWLNKTDGKGIDPRIISAANTGRVRSPETRAKMSRAKKGLIPWHKGKHLSEEHRQILSLAAKKRSARRLGISQ